jgi:hypothetical protein
MKRRHLLRGAAGLGLGLPFLSSLSESAEAAPGGPRLIVFFTPLGTVKSNWRPRTLDGSDFAPSGTLHDDYAFTVPDQTHILSPLDAFKDRLLILDNIDMLSAYEGPGDAHQLGIGHALTGSLLQEGDLFQYGCGMGSVGWGGGASIDQAIAAHVLESELIAFGSLELGVQVDGDTVSHRINYKGPGYPIQPDNDPQSVFDRVFASPPDFGKLKAERKHVLDFVMDDYHRLRTRLGSDDRYKLDGHLAAVEAIAQRLDAPPIEYGGSCVMPDVSGAPPDPMVNDDMPFIGQLQMDLLAMALICGATRVATLQWRDCFSNKTFPWLGIFQGHHELSHSNVTSLPDQQKLVAIYHWYAQQYAYLLGLLDAVEEGDGKSVLDNSIVVWCTDISQGQSHSRSDMPYVIAGGGAGYLKTGRYLRLGGESHQNLLVTLANAMGMPITEFGMPEFCDGPLDAIVA